MLSLSEHVVAIEIRLNLVVLEVFRNWGSGTLLYLVHWVFDRRHTTLLLARQLSQREKENAI